MADAVIKERELQSAYAATGRFTAVPYLHSSRVPLDQVKFSTEAGPETLDLFGNECEGMCGV